MFMPILRSALRRMRVRPVRTVLTLLQLLLGAFAMTLALIALTHTPTTSSQQLDERFDVVARIPVEPSGYQSHAIFGRNGLPEILELAPAVQLAALSNASFGPRLQVERNGELFEFDRTATVSPEYFQIEGLIPARGAFFGAAEEAVEAPVIVISDDAAEVLFGTDSPIGQELAVRPRFPNQPESDHAQVVLRVIGTFAADDRADNPFLRIGAFVPLWQQANTGFRGSASTNLNILGKPGQAAEARAQVLAAAATVFAAELQGRDLNASALQVLEPEQPFRPAGPNLMIIIFAVFGLVAIIAGAIGIFSITIVDVVERTPEIGLRRALGASSRRITLELVAEAALQAAAGALAGVLLALLLLPAINRNLGYSLIPASQGSPTPDPLAALTVLALIVITGGLLALIPAGQAGRLRPVEALREE